jgi:hypothetical protein
MSGHIVIWLLQQPCYNASGGGGGERVRGVENAVDEVLDETIVTYFCSDINQPQLAPHRQSLTRKSGSTFDFFLIIAYGRFTTSPMHPGRDPLMRPPRLLPNYNENGYILIRASNA